MHGRSPHRAELYSDCRTCTLRSESHFCSLPAEALEELDRRSYAQQLPAGTVLFEEADPSRGVHLLCHGKVRLAVEAPDGKTLILREAGEGEAIPLGGIFVGGPCGASAETVEPTQVKFLKKDDFLAWLERAPVAWKRVARQLALEAASYSSHLRTLGLSHSAAEKLAHLILEWAALQGRPASNGTRVPLHATHHEIAQVIGTSRETVTRLFRTLRQKNVVTIRGNSLTIVDRGALERLDRIAAQA